MLYNTEILLQFDSHEIHGAYVWEILLLKLFFFIYNTQGQS